MIRIKSGCMGTDDEHTILYYCFYMTCHADLIHSKSTETVYVKLNNRKCMMYSRL